MQYDMYCSNKPKIQVYILPRNCRILFNCSPIGRHPSVSNCKRKVMGYGRVMGYGLWEASNLSIGKMRNAHRIIIVDLEET